MPEHRLLSAPSTFSGPVLEGLLGQKEAHVVVEPEGGLAEVRVQSQLLLLEDSHLLPPVIGAKYVDAPAHFGARGIRLDLPELPLQTLVGPISQLLVPVVDMVDVPQLRHSLI